MSVAVATPPREATLERRTLRSAASDRLFFAQVREDPVVELQALALRPEDSVVVVSSGGCTALSLLGAGPRAVAAVDVNTNQNHLVELKAAAIAGLDRDEAMRFIGAWPADAAWRRRTYASLRDRLGAPARAYWDGHTAALGRGLLEAGVSERFLRLIVAATRHLVHSPRVFEALFAATTLAEQRAFYDSTWNNRRWRAAMRLLVNRATFHKTFHSDFMEHVEDRDLSRHFRRLIEHVLTEVPIADNYFFREMLLGSYAVDSPGALPPYLQPEPMAAVGASLDRLTLVDGTVTEHLQTCSDRSIDAFALSNIVEWVDGPGLDALFDEVVRTARPGARAVFRNFLGWTRVPDRHRDVLVEDVALGERLIAGDRSGMQKRVAVCRVR
jgi:S-adenosylmethionine-diacylglycerol 3-amino-3-carboxypropyl transferase